MNSAKSVKRAAERAFIPRQPAPKLAIGEKTGGALATERAGSERSAPPDAASWSHERLAVERLTAPREAVADAAEKILGILRARDAQIRLNPIRDSGFFWSGSP